MRPAPLFVLSLLFACPRPAAAQQAEQITVMAPGMAGSPTATTQISAAAIAQSGSASIGALLDQIPAFGSQGINSAQNDGGFGAYFIDLRNLNFDRTLVLVDGSRFVLSGIQTDEAVDLNDIPAPFIDHIEVLKDGTQPQYGPDAVAGAVNLVLKDQIDGLHLESYGAATGAEDGGTAEITLLGGHALPAGHAAFGLDYEQRDPVAQSARAWSANPIASDDGGDIVHGSPATLGGHAIGPGIDTVALANGAITPYNARDDFNTATDRYLQGGLRRAAAYVDADSALSDSIDADIELLFTDRSATTQDSPPILGLTGTAKNPDGFTIPASDPFNPFGAPVTLERVIGEAGAQTTSISGPVWRVLGGLNGTLPASSGWTDWSWSLRFDHGQSLSHYVADNQVNLTRALQTAGNGACPASAGCVEANWFGPGSLSAQALRYILYTARSQSAYGETLGEAGLAGPLFALQGRQARLQLGLSARAESGSTSVDPVTAAGDQAGNDAAPTAGHYDAYDLHASLDLPLLRDTLLAHSLDTGLTARGTDTSRYGAFPTLRGVIAYAPTPWLHLRASAGTARRPPAISEAFGGITGAPQPVTDPCDARLGLRANRVVNANCLAQGLSPGFTQSTQLIDVESGGNPHLRPERSFNDMLGISATPPGLPWLTASTDYYHYRIADAIDSLADTDPDLIPDLCYQSAHLASPLCGLITRIAGGGTAGQISSILARDENVGIIKTDGLEFGLTLKPPPGPLGRLTLSWQSTWLLDYLLHTNGQPGFTQYAGSFPGLNAVGSYARLRGRGSAALDRGAWSFGWTIRTLSGARVLGATPGEPFGKAPGVIYQDIDITRRFGHLTAMAGIDNLANQAPPTLLDGQTNTDTSSYDVVGRLVWGRVVYDF